MSVQNIITLRAFDRKIAEMVSMRESIINNGAIFLKYNKFKNINTNALKSSFKSACICKSTGVEIY